MPAIDNETLIEVYQEQCDRDGVGDVFRELLDEGNSPGFAAMLARQSPPSTNTDREFNHGLLNNQQFDDMPPFMARKMLAAAKTAGINPNGKVFKHQLGKVTDPRAWVESKADVIRTCEEKGLACTGEDGSMIKYQPPEKDKPDPVPVNPAIVDRLANQEAEKPSNRGKSKEELKEAVVHKHTPARKKHLIEPFLRKQREKPKAKPITARVKK